MAPTCSRCHGAGTVLEPVDKEPITRSVYVGARMKVRVCPQCIGHGYSWIEWNEAPK